jgi:tripartite-type tricarboxylate transporter receptor subunit TctC
MKLTAGLAVAFVACIGLWSGAAAAQRYPVKPVRILIGFSPGGGADTVARILAQKLSEALGQPVTVENRAGAGGTIATEATARAPADGHTLQVISAAEPAQGTLRKLTYDLARDLAPVSLVATGAFMLVVHPSVPARTVKDVIALSRARSGKLNYSSAGVGGTPHLAAELFKSMAKVNIVHVPYKGGSDAVIATAGGEVDMTFNSLPAVLPLLTANKLRSIAVTSAKRAQTLPAVPTIAESGLPGYDLSGWFGMLAPAGVPKDIVARINGLIGTAVASAEMQDALAKQGLEPRTSTPEEFGAFIRREIARSTDLIKATGAKAD